MVLNEHETTITKTLEELNLLLTFFRPQGCEHAKLRRDKDPHEQGTEAFGYRDDTSEQNHLTIDNGQN